MSRRNSTLLTVALFFCAQLLLAAHTPSHLTTGHNEPLSLVTVSDCEICLPGQGAAPLPLALEPAPTDARPVTPPTFPQPPSTRLRVPGSGPRAPPVFS